MRISNATTNRQKLTPPPTVGGGGWMGNFQKDRKMPKAIYTVIVYGVNGRNRITKETSLRAVKTLCHGLNLDISVYRNDEKILRRDENYSSSSCNKFKSHSILMRRRMNKSGYLFAPPCGIPVNMKVLDK